MQRDEELLTAVDRLLVDFGPALEFGLKRKLAAQRAVSAAFAPDAYVRVGGDTLAEVQHPKVLKHLLDDGCRRTMLNKNFLLVSRIDLHQVLASVVTIVPIGTSEPEARVMAQMMKAAVVHEFGKPLKIEEVPIPTPRRGEVLIKLVANGVCHTDLHAAQGDWPAKPTPPFIKWVLAHERRRWARRSS